MGQCEPKERGFKQGFKELQRSKALKNQDREKKQWGLCISSRALQHTWPQLCQSVYPVSFLNLQLPLVKPVRSNNNQGVREKTSLQQGRKHMKHPLQGHTFKPQSRPKARAAIARGG
jgi:hypothetical protein